MSTKPSASSLWRMVFAIWVICLSSVAWAQDSSSLADYVSAYREARARGDLVATEAAASAALSASETNEQHSELIPALLVNLARARIELGQWEAARTPARRAFDSARERPAGAGVDLILSQLVYARVRLHLEGREALGFLQDALESAEARDDLVSDRYSAAEQLGRWALEMHRYDLAQSAWAATANAASGAPYDATFARGRAHAYEGIAITLQSVTREIRMPGRVAREAREQFAAAHPLLQPYAILDSDDGSLTHPQEVYAQLLAWDAVVWSKMTSEDNTRRIHERLAPNPTAIADVSLCPVQVDRGRLFFPTVQANEGQIGAVVVRLRFDAEGNHLTTDVAAAVGDEGFTRIVVASLPDWTANIQASAGGCQPPAIVYAPIAFSYRD